MSLILTFIVLIFVNSAVGTDIDTFYLGTRCIKPPCRANLWLGGTTKSYNSTRVIKGGQGEDYPYLQNNAREIEVIAPPGHHIVAALRKLHLRANCIDTVTIYANHENHTFCGLKYDEYEKYSITAQERMIIRLMSDSDRRGFIYSTGFELTVTAYRDGPCDRTREFSCGNGRCIAKELNCNEHNHCGDNSDQQCASTTRTPSNCSAKGFRCANGNCLDFDPDYDYDLDDYSPVCDGRDDCGDLSDELNCTRTCFDMDFTCANGNCIGSVYVCDAYNDCGDFSDEVNCTYTCQPWQFLCANGRCVHYMSQCDGENNCFDWSDEQNCTHGCWDWQFPCSDGRCVWSSFVCNGVNDCGDWSDEVNCNCSSEKNFLCRNDKCVDSWYVCNGQNDCGDSSDENGCPKRISSNAIMGIVFGSSIVLCAIICSIVYFVHKRVSRRRHES